MSSAKLGGTASKILLGVDVGGTFTDAVLVFDGKLFSAKIPTTADQSEAVMAAALKVISQAGLRVSDVSYFAHGMTTATNALLERKGARTVSIATWGFRDLLEIGRQNRPRLYDLCPQRPEMLVPRGMRLAADERITPDGVEISLSDEEVRRLIGELIKIGPESIAICLLFSFLDDSHERKLLEHIRRELPHVHISLSSLVLPQFREFERFSTTAVDAYLTPVVARYLRDLGKRAAEQGLPEPAIMQSSGGVVPLERAAASAAPLLLSGPAAGVTGSLFSCGLSGIENLLAFDMGGTSTDVTLIRDGNAGTTTEYEIGGLPVALPMVDILTIGAGGGSIAWIDSGGALRVGPESAGADPGPACYGRGGAAPTVTDANLCLGYLGGRLGGEDGLPLHREAAIKAVSELAIELGVELEEAAGGIRRVANSGMVRALRVISIERGHDPRDFILVAFGGAGPMHGIELAQELGMGAVMVPGACGVLSALGMVVGDQRRDWARTVYEPGGAQPQAIEDAYGEMEAAALAELNNARLVRMADLRYRGQSHELTVPVGRPFDMKAVINAFGIEHERVYGFRTDRGEVELVSIRLTALITLEKPELAPSPPVPEEIAVRPAFFDGRWLEARKWRREAMGDAVAIGPAVIDEDEATTVVPPGWAARVDQAGNLWIEADRT